jgi:hypothetical protein
MGTTRGPKGSPTFRQTARATLAGALLGCGVGLGAYNHWVVALVVGVPLAVAAVFVAPRPRRIDGLVAGGHSSTNIPVLVEAVTRSSLDASNVQPTLVTATISPPNDTDYRARWLSAMPKGMAANLLHAADNRLPSGFIPSRPDSTVPDESDDRRAQDIEFGDHPAKPTVALPVITIAIAAALFFGVGTGWHVSVSLPDTGFSSSTGSGDGSEHPAQERVDAMLAEVDKLGPGASSNIFALSLGTDGSDRIQVYDPATGESVSMNYSSSSESWYGPNRSSTAWRSPRTFRADELSQMQFTTIVERMSAALPEQSRDFQSMEIARSGDDLPVVATATFGESYENEIDIQADTDSNIAIWFDPADFGVAMTLAQETMTEVALQTDLPIIERFEIRGTAPGTPIMRAGEIQNSGGVLIDFTAPDRTGSLSIVPGFFPALRSSENTSGRTRDGSVAFEDLSAATFEAVRDDYMRRNQVDAFDRAAVDIQTSHQYVLQDYQTTIMVQVGPNDPIAYYTLDGQFLTGD